MGWDGIYGGKSQDSAENFYNANGYGSASGTRGKLNRAARPFSAYDPRYRALNFSNLSLTGGGGNAIGTQTLPELGGGFAMGDPMTSAIARRRQRFASSGIGLGPATMLANKTPGGE